MGTGAKRDCNKMIDTPMPKLIISLSIPTIISMLITNIYNLADAYFVGNLGTSASGAIGIILSVQAILQAFGFMFGHGAGGIISRKLGEKDSHGASRYASTSFFFSLGAGALVGILILLFLDPCLKFLGCTDSILPYARSYGRYILIAAPLVTSSCTLNNILRYEGKASLAMVGLASGGILNMIGDPILMFGCHLGMDGAGLSTALSQLISFLLLLYMFLSGKSESKIRLSYVTKKPKEMLNIVANGFPSMLRQGFNSMSTMILNQSAGVYGDTAIAAMSIVNRIGMFIVAIVIGLGQAFQPVAAYNYGAKNFKRVREAYLFTFKIAEVFLVVIVALGFLFAAPIVAVFQKDPAVVTIGVAALHFQCISLVLQPISVYANMMFQCVGKSMIASLLASLRSGIFFIPLILLLPKFIGITGIESAQMGADLLTTFTAIPFVWSFLRELRLKGND
ncbi:MAG: MATE family efflux transporter [bacterium]|nr:MATE family efflux transporter [bacterium]